MGGIQLGQEPGEIAQALDTVGVLERLVLGEHVDEPLTHLITVLAQEPAAPVAQRRHHLLNLGVGAERLRHAAAPEAVGARLP